MAWTNGGRAQPDRRCGRRRQHRDVVVYSIGDDELTAALRFATNANTL
jgi:hypothetical protein